jgi:hypothetical protein
MGVTYLNTSFSSTFRFMIEETEIMHQYAIVDFKRLVLSDVKIEGVVTSDKNALKSALSFVGPTAPQPLYFWYVEMNVLTKVKKLQRVDRAVLSGPPLKSNSAHPFLRPLLGVAPDQ